MTNERLKKLEETLILYDEREPNYERHTDYDSQQVNGINMEIPRDSRVVKKLEEQGFKVIYPATLSVRGVSNMSDAERSNYEHSVNTSALIVDTQEQYNSIDFAKMITYHFNREETFIRGRCDDLDRYDRSDNSLKCDYSTSILSAGASGELHKILTDVGFDTTLERFFFTDTF